GAPRLDAACPSNHRTSTGCCPGAGRPGAGPCRCCRCRTGCCPDVDRPNAEPPGGDPQDAAPDPALAHPVLPGAGSRPDVRTRPDARPAGPAWGGPDPA